MGYSMGYSMGYESCVAVQYANMQICQFKLFVIFIYVLSSKLIAIRGISCLCLNLNGVMHD